jgi:tetratricopeptide (TPR) repeat protein
VYSNLGQTQASEENRQKAFELRDRASEREQLYIASHYYADSGQLDKGITALELYRQTYPRDPTPYNNLGNIYIQLGQFDNALENMKRAVELDPDMLSGYENLASAYVGLNRIEEARATINAGLQRKLTGFSLYSMLAGLDWAEGKDADMEKHLESAAANPAGAVWALGFRFDLAATRGQVRKAHELAGQMQDALDRLHLQGRADAEAGLAGTDALVGNQAAAIAEANRSVRDSRAFKVLFSAAVALAACRQEKAADDLASEIQRTRPNDTIAQNVAVPVIHAMVSLLPAGAGKASPEDAIDQLNSAVVYARANTGVYYVRGLAYEQAKRDAEAQQDFQKVLDLKPLHGPDLVVVAAQLELGRVYQKLGDPGKARIAYQNFFATWKDADPDLPLLKAAKAEYAKLQ